MEAYRFFIFFLEEKLYFLPNGQIVYWWSRTWCIELLAVHMNRHVSWGCYCIPTSGVQGPSSSKEDWSTPNLCLPHHRFKNKMVGGTHSHVLHGSVGKNSSAFLNICKLTAIYKAVLVFQEQVIGFAYASLLRQHHNGGFYPLPGRPNTSLGCPDLSSGLHSSICLLQGRSI